MAISQVPMTQGLITLAPITPAARARVAHLRVAEHQEKFSGTIEDAFALNDDTTDFHVILEGQTPVGFFKIDRNYGTDFAFVEKDELGLRAFLIDLDRQGQGLATKAVMALPAYLHAHYPDAPSVVLTVNMANPGAIRAYRRGGFLDTGDIYEGGQAGAQLAMRMILSNA